MSEKQEMTSDEVAVEVQAPTKGVEGHRGQIVTCRSLHDFKGPRIAILAQRGSRPGTWAPKVLWNPGDEVEQADKDGVLRRLTLYPEPLDQKDVGQPVIPKGCDETLWLEAASPLSLAGSGGGGLSEEDMEGLKSVMAQAIEESKAAKSEARAASKEAEQVGEYTDKLSDKAMKAIDAVVTRLEEAEQYIKATADSLASLSESVETLLERSTAPEAPADPKATKKS